MGEWDGHQFFFWGLYFYNPWFLCKQLNVMMLKVHLLTIFLKDTFVLKEI